MPRPIVVTVLAFAAAIFAGRASAQEPLPKDSPFLPVAGSLPAGLSANENLTLAGVTGSEKTALVCIYDTQIKRSYWIPVGSTTEGIKVLSYDSARDQAVITVGGQQKLLTLRKAPVANAGANPSSPSSGGRTIDPNSHSRHAATAASSRLRGAAGDGSPDARERFARDRHAAAQSLRGSAEKSRGRKEKVLRTEGGARMRQASKT
jgi:hypothetical protein